MQILKKPSQIKILVKKIDHTLVLLPNNALFISFLWLSYPKLFYLVSCRPKTLLLCGSSSHFLYNNNLFGVLVIFPFLFWFELGWHNPLYNAAKVVLKSKFSSFFHRRTKIQLQLIHLWTNLDLYFRGRLIWPDFWKICLPYISWTTKLQFENFFRQPPGRYLLLKWSAVE